MCLLTECDLWDALQGTQQTSHGLREKFYN